MKKIGIVLLTLLLSACSDKNAEQPIVVQMYMANDKGQGDYVGTVTITQNYEGLLFTPDLQHLTPGTHGFHLHQNPSCAPAEKDNIMVAAQSAGGHFDPANTGKHEGPEGHGHLGDLPALTVNAQGLAQTPVLAPRIKHLKEINNTALMIHVGSDNYSDTPETLGGGGARMVCGIVTQHHRL